MYEKNAQKFGLGVRNRFSFQFPNFFFNSVVWCHVKNSRLCGQWRVFCLQQSWTTDCKNTVYPFQLVGKQIVSAFLLVAMITVSLILLVCQENIFSFTIGWQENIYCIMKKVPCFLLVGKETVLLFNKFQRKHMQHFLCLSRKHFLLYHWLARKLLLRFYSLARKQFIIFTTKHFLFFW